MPKVNQIDLIQGFYTVKPLENELWEITLVGKRKKKLAGKWKYIDHIEGYNRFKRVE